MDTIDWITGGVVVLAMVGAVAAAVWEGSKAPDWSTFYADGELTCKDNRWDGSKVRCYDAAGHETCRYVDGGKRNAAPPPGCYREAT